MWMQSLRVVFLAPMSYESWCAAKGHSGNPVTSETWLTGFAVVALALAVVLFIWTYAKHRRTENNLRDNITNLTITTFKLRQKKDQLVAANKDLQRAIAELSRKQAAVLGTMKSR